MTDIMPPPDPALHEVDWTALEALTRRADELRRAGQLTAAAFDELWREGLAASGGREDLLGTLEMFRP